MKSPFRIAIRVLVLVFLIAGQGWTVRPVHSAVDYYLVNSISDNPDNNPGDLICADSNGLCTLRAAIQEINVSGFKNRILISDMPVDTFIINTPLTISRAMTITGLGRDITKIQFNGVPNSTINGMVVTANLTLNALTLRNFYRAMVVDTPGLVINFNNSQISDNFSGLSLRKFSTVNLKRTLIKNNISISGTPEQAIINLGGIINLIESSVTNNQSAECGGIKLQNPGAVLNAFNSTIASNTAVSANGGGLCNLGGTVTLIDTAVSGNTAGMFGGGIFQDGGQLLISGYSQVNNNSALRGGGIYSSKGSVIIESELTFLPQINSNNAVTSGGGLYLAGDGDFRIFGALIQNNRVDNSSGTHSAQGGGIYFVQDTLQRALDINDSVITGNRAIAGNGGGITTTGSKAFLTINNSTISGNQASNHGGGIFAGEGTVVLANTTITNNTCNSDTTDVGQGGGLYRFRAAVTLRNSIIAGNIDLKSQPWEFYAPDVDGTIISDGYNLIGIVNDWITFTGNTVGNILNMDPELDPLTTNASAPQPERPHHPLKSTSPAVNGGNPGGCRDTTGVVMSTDALGNPRSHSGRCDMGAVESTHSPVLYLIDLSAVPIVVKGGNLITGTVTLNQMAPSGGTVITLSSNKPSEATVPATVTIPAGSYSHTFTIQTSPLSTDSLVTISAKLGSVTRSVILVVRAQDLQPGLVQITIQPSSVIGGKATVATVALDRNAPSGGTVVTLASDQPELIIPPSTLVSAGSSVGTFVVDTTAVSMKKLATLSATLDGVTRSTILILDPVESHNIYLPIISR